MVNARRLAERRGCFPGRVYETDRDYLWGRLEGQ